MKNIKQNFNEESYIYLDNEKLNEIGKELFVKDLKNLSREELIKDIQSNTKELNDEDDNIIIEEKKSNKEFYKEYILNSTNDKDIKEYLESLECYLLL